jgi:ankyrin repeat protein
LHSAAFYGEIEMVQLLLKYKADINARTNDGGTPLHFASKGYHSGRPNIGLSLSNVARLLLEHGADVNAQGSAYSSPLHEAAERGRVEVMRVLLEHGADLGAVDRHGRTVLQVSLNDETRKLLSEHRAK